MLLLLLFFFLFLKFKKSIDLFVKQRSKLLSKDELSCFFNYFDRNFDTKIDF